MAYQNDASQRLICAPFEFSGHRSNRVFRVTDPILVFYGGQTTVDTIHRCRQWWHRSSTVVFHHYASRSNISSAVVGTLSNMGLTKQKSSCSSGPWSTHHHTRFVRDTLSCGKVCGGTSLFAIKIHSFVFSLLPNADRSMSPLYTALLFSGSITLMFDHDGSRMSHKRVHYWVFTIHLINLPSMR